MSVPEDNPASRKADVLTRLGALAIDGLIAAIGSLVISLVFSFVYLGFLGALAAIAFWLLRDTLLDGQSPGKFYMDLKAVHVTSRRPLTREQSIRRNAPGAVPYVGWLVSSLMPLGLSGFFSVIGMFVSLGVVGYDAYYWYKHQDTGRRWGDVLGETIVIGLSPDAVASDEADAEPERETLP